MGCIYVNYNWDNIAFAVDTIQGLLEAFYKDVRALMRNYNPDLVFVFHDAFHFDAHTWNDMFPDDDHGNVVMDTHQYFAWWGAQDDIGNYCDGYGGTMSQAFDVKYDVWVGEWALATDVCALWLGGFNDNNTPYAFGCDWVECPKPYLPEHLSPDFDRTAEMLGPYGSNTLSTIQNGKCPRDSAHFPKDDIKRLGQCATYVMDDMVQGMFMWTFRNELEDKWNYITAYDNEWIKRTNFPPADNST